MSDVIINRVAQSSLITLDLEKHLPAFQIEEFDLKPHLFMEMILKEKDFRQAMKDFSWEQYENKIVALHCSADAIIPLWAYMLVASYARPFARDVVYGTVEEVRERLLLKNLEALDFSQYQDARVVVKGCGKLRIPESAYVEVTNRLLPVAKSIMFGEPCSTVPVYKAKK